MHLGYRRVMLPVMMHEELVEERRRLGRDAFDGRVTADALGVQLWMDGESLVIRDDIAEHRVDLRDIPI